MSLQCYGSKTREKSILSKKEYLILVPAKSEDQSNLNRAGVMEHTTHITTNDWLGILRTASKIQFKTNFNIIHPYFLLGSKRSMTSLALANPEYQSNLNIFDTTYYWAHSNHWWSIRLVISLNFWKVKSIQKRILTLVPAPSEDQSNLYRFADYATSLIDIIHYGWGRIHWCYGGYYYKLCSEGQY